MLRWREQRDKSTTVCEKKSTNLRVRNIKMKSAIKVTKHLVFYGVLLGVWQALAALHLWPPYLFPAPLEVLASLRAGFADHSFWIAIGVSMKRMLVGYVI